MRLDWSAVRNTMLKHIGELLRDAPEATCAFMRQTEITRQYTATVREVLLDDGAWVISACVHQDRLEITAAGPGAAWQLRYYGPRLQAAIERRHGIKLRRVRITHQAGTYTTPQRYRARPLLTAHNARIVEQTARTLPPGRLQQALLRLAAGATR